MMCNFARDIPLTTNNLNEVTFRLTVINNPNFK